MKMLGIATSALLVAGCASSDGKPQAVGLPNPASSYCVQIGGKLSIENRPGGQVGICMLPDGTKVDEWELYRRDHPQKYVRFLGCMQVRFEPPEMEERPSSR